MPSQGHTYRDAWHPLQEAIFTKLNSFSITDINAATVQILDQVDENQSAAYIVIGRDKIRTPFNTKIEPGYDYLVTVTIYSNYDGNRDLQLIADQVLEALTLTNLDLSADNYNVVWFRVEEATVEDDITAGHWRAYTLILQYVIQDKI